MVTKEENLHEYLQYDDYLRNALLDHFFIPGTTFEQFASNEYQRLADFIHQPYQYDIQNEKNFTNILLYRDGFFGQSRKKFP